MTENRLRLEYQPVLDMATGRVAWVEALLRCPAGDGGWLLNDELIPAVANSVDRTLTFGIRVLRLAIEQALLWKQSGNGVRVAVNLLPAHVEDEVFLWCLGNELEREGIGVNDLIIEIPEDKPAVAGSRLETGMRRLADMGFTVVVDNFAGLSDVLLLREMGVSLLKTDRRFGASLHLEDGRRVVEAMSAFCRARGFDLAVVGIESAEAARDAESMGIAAKQGFHCAPPMTASACTSWLESALAATS